MEHPTHLINSLVLVVDTKEPKRRTELGIRVVYVVVPPPA